MWCLLLGRAVVQLRGGGGGYERKNDKHGLKMFFAFGSVLRAATAARLVEVAASDERVDHHQRRLGLELRHHVALPRV